MPRSPSGVFLVLFSQLFAVAENRLQLMNWLENTTPFRTIPAALRCKAFEPLFLR